MTFIRLLALLALAVAHVAQAQAPKYPDKLVRIVVPYPAGGGSDTMARLVAQKLSDAWGQSVIVENKPGASGNIGLDMVAKSPGDGYTLLVMPSNHSINPPLYGNLPFDPIKDFTPIIAIGSSPVLVAVNGSVPVRSVAELIARLKAQPGSLSYASCGNGTPQHLAGELMKATAGVDMTHVPYKGCSVAIPDLLSGQVQVGFSTVANLSPHLKSGKIAGLAVTSKKRSALAPDIPTVAESGLPGYDVDVWFGLLGPARMPPAVVAKINRDVNAILSSAEVRERMLAAYYEPIGGTPEQFAALIHSDLVRWGKLIKDVGIKVD